MSKYPTEKAPLLSATAVPVHAYQPESLTMSRTVQQKLHMRFYESTGWINDT